MGHSVLAELPKRIQNLKQALHRSSLVEPTNFVEKWTKVAVFGEFEDDIKVVQSLVDVI